MRIRLLLLVLCLALVLAFAGTQPAFGIVVIGGHLAVTVRGTGGVPLANTRIDVVDLGGGYLGPYATDSDGFWGSGVLPPGGYKVLCIPQTGNYAQGWLSDSGPVPTGSMADTLTVHAAATTTVDVMLPVGATISGTITKHGSGAVLSPIGVSPYFRDPATGSWSQVYGTSNGMQGDYRLGQLLPGTYRLQFLDSHFGRYLEQWWNNKPTVSAADGITIAEGQMVTGRNAVMHASVTNESVAGGSRILTAINASQRMYPNATTHADAVVITNGYNWPDALGGSAFAGVLNAPILLNAAPPSAMPKALDDEIVRLKNNGATEAYILGGASAVSSAVEARLASIFGGTSHVFRIPGANRYDTSLLIAQTTRGKAGAAWGGVVFLARGNDYPDALAAAPLAAKKHWPVLLAEGDGHGNVSQRVRDFLGWNAGVKVIILGSNSAIPSSMATSVANVVGGWGKVERWEGPDRIATSISVADHSIDFGMNYGAVGVATGYGYADALCGGPFLAQQNVPLLLTANTTPLRPALSAKLISLSPIPMNVWFLGGTPAVSQSVRNAVVDGLQ